MVDTDCVDNTYNLLTYSVGEQVSVQISGVLLSQASSYDSVRGPFHSLPVSSTGGVRRALYVATGVATAAIDSCQMLVDA